MENDKPNLTSIDVGFKPSPHLIETAARLRQLAEEIERGEVYSVAYTFVGKDSVTTHLSVGKQRFELAGGIAHLGYRVHSLIEEN